MSCSAMLKPRSTFLPLAMSAAGLALVLGTVAIFGVVREADEGTAAHPLQLLSGLQLPIVAFFAAKWLPRHPRMALRVLALQAAAGLAALVPIYWFQLQAGRRERAEQPAAWAVSKKSPPAAASGSTIPAVPVRQHQEVPS